MKHALVVGGTGMLRAASLSLSIRSEWVSVVARDEGRLADLAEAASGIGGRLMPWSADYRDDLSLATTVNAARDAFGPVDTVVAWIHSDAYNAPVLIARLVGADGFSFRYFDVTGSGDPDSLRRADERREALRGVRGLVYRRIVLGGVPDGEGLRWLTNEEISKGVLDAIDRDAAETTVGEICG